jgi:hypothetical protein
MALVIILSLLALSRNTARHVKVDEYYVSRFWHALA